VTAPRDAVDMRPGVAIVCSRLGSVDPSRECRLSLPDLAVDVHVEGEWISKESKGAA